VLAGPAVHGAWQVSQAARGLGALNAFGVLWFGAFTVASAVLLPLVWAPGRRRR
jgi:hypothetical protein